MEVGAQVEVKGYIRYDPVICKLLVTEGSIEKGDYIPQIGTIEKVEDEGFEVEKGSCRDQPYVVTTRISDEQFKDLDPHLQFKMMNLQMEKLQAMLRGAYNRHGINDDLENEQTDAHRDPTAWERFFLDYGFGKKFKIPVEN